MKRFKLLKPFALLPTVHSTGMRFLLITFMCFTSTQIALAEVVCPTDNVRTDRPGTYAYHFAEKASATCTNRIAIPANGVRVFSSKMNCTNGVVVLRSIGSVPVSRTCDNCTNTGTGTVAVALGTSTNFRAYFKISDGTEDVRYDGTFTRSADSPSVCTLSGSIRGSSFGGDATRPTASIAALTGPTAAGTYTAAITLSETSVDFDATDLTLVNATAAMTGSGTSYSVTLTPTADGLVSVTVSAGSFSDAAGNTNDAVSNTVSATYDTTRPTVSIAALTGPTSGTYTAAITLSESSTDFDATDLTLVNATATLSGSGNSYTATATPSGDGLVSVTVAAESFSDAAGNTNAAASNTASATFTAVKQAGSLSIIDANGQPITSGISTLNCGAVQVGGSVECTVTGTLSGISSAEGTISFEPLTAASRTLYERLQQLSLWNLIGISDAIAVGPGDFTVLTANPFTINNNSTKTFTFRFRPTAAGSSDGVVVLTFSDNSVFRFTITGNGTVATLVSAPQNIPVFGPFGLLVMLMGLLWFGQRRNSR